jgi:hypothetical protein
MGQDENIYSGIVFSFYGGNAYDPGWLHVSHGGNTGYADEELIPKTRMDRLRL